MRFIPLFLTSLAMSVAPVSAGINFVIEFEPGSKWFTESWSADARAEMQSFLTDVGNLFDTEETVRISINDNATGSVYASAGSSWAQWYYHEEAVGFVAAPALWLIVVKGVHNPAAATDVTLTWNLNVNAGSYGGSSAALINNIRGLGPHEMHHAFGASSRISLGPGADPRGTEQVVDLIDSYYRDLNGERIIGTFNPSGYKFGIRNFPMSAGWDTEFMQTGLYFPGRDKQGRVVKMAPISSGGTIDFSHIYGISYTFDHPAWASYVDEDFNFLRGLGYPLMVDSALVQQGANVTAFNFAGSNATLTCGSSAGNHYRLATTADLRHWKVMPVGTPGTGSPLGFTYPIDKTNEPKRIFQVVEVPE